MNECLTTPQHEKQIGYWVSEKGKKKNNNNNVKTDYKEGHFYLTSHSTYFIYGYMASDMW